MAENPFSTGKARYLHTMIRVKDLDKSMDFYTRLLGMKELRKKDFPSGEFTLAFGGYGEETAQTVIELTHNWDQDEPYDLGNGFGHFALAVPDVATACDILASEALRFPGQPAR